MRYSSLGGVEADCILLLGGTAELEEYGEVILPNPFICFNLFKYSFIRIYPLSY
jgi:hypothetical protein